MHKAVIASFSRTLLFSSKPAVSAFAARYSGSTVHFADEHNGTGRTLTQRIVPVVAILV
ncbi:hypothetical protein PVAP13_6KG238506 [Panicum virgatum]|uniref:Uncharacterized protein n=1 Tax=Panicum virgatum TaxID=38727 RepID=A0A8T0RIE8_PANVG|nr:hypothetical protein PVAP13_6KG238506 [Panicum virgatum]